MIVRLRSRDGMEKVDVGGLPTTQGLRAAIEQALQLPSAQVVVSKDKGVLMAKDASGFGNLLAVDRGLAELGVGHGDMLFMWYPFQRDVAPAVKAPAFTPRTFGEKMTVEDLIAKQTRIERQEKPHCASVSFDRAAGHAFHAYTASALTFSIKRGGLLFGSRDGEGRVRVEAIYEPPQAASSWAPRQEGTADSLRLERGTPEEERVRFVAGHLGLQLVGWVFCQSTRERDFIVSSEEVQQMAAVQDEVGPTAVTAIVSTFAGEEGPETAFEVFQVSDQAVRLWKEGWFKPPDEPSGLSRLINPKAPKQAAPVIVAGKDVGEVDNDYFLLPCSILDHAGPLETAFPVENRLTGQSVAEVRQHLQRRAGQPWAQRLADFHLLLFLAAQPQFDRTDLAAIVGAVRAGGDIPEGYVLLIESLAHL